MGKIAPIMSRVFWWEVTLVTLIVVDDLVIGPVFWLLAAACDWLTPAYGAMIATSVAFLASASLQVWLTWKVLSDSENPRVRRMIDRLLGGRKSSQIKRREASLRNRAGSLFGAILVTPLIGGVLPVVFLFRRGQTDMRTLRHLAVLTAVVYATEFALIHGGYGFGRVTSMLLAWMV